MLSIAHALSFAVIFPLASCSLAGKVFPKLKPKLSKKTTDSSLALPPPDPNQLDNIDYVFRIVSSFKPSKSVRKFSH